MTEGQIRLDKARTHEVPWKIQRDRMMAGLPAHLRIDLISAKSRQQWWGNLPAQVIPPVLFLVWAVAYLFATS